MLLAVVVFGVLGLIALTPKTTKIQPTSKKETTSIKTTASKKTTSPQVSVATITPGTGQSAPVTSTQVTTPVVTHPTSTNVRTGVKTEPVVTPAPSSSVSGLTPTTPASNQTSNPGSGSNSPPKSSPPPPTTTTSYTSTNWSGYLAAGGQYTAISGSWLAPNPTGNGSTTSADGTWIGIGGVLSSDLIQVGTQDSVSASGQIRTAAFYELLPGVSITIPSLSVTPGDHMSASINETSINVWQFTISDTTSNQTYTQNVSYSSTNSSAEWIEEDPGYSNGSLVPLDNFGTVYFSASITTSQGTVENLSTAGALPITLVNGSNQPIATPSSIGSDGASFDVVHQ